MLAASVQSTDELIAVIAHCEVDTPVSSNDGTNVPAVEAIVMVLNAVPKKSDPVESVLKLASRDVVPLFNVTRTTSPGAGAGNIASDGLPEVS